MKALWALAFLAAAAPALARTASLRASRVQRSKSAEAARLRLFGVEIGFANSNTGISHNSSASGAVQEESEQRHALGYTDDEEDDGKGPALRTVCTVKGTGAQLGVGNVNVLLNRFTNERVLSFGVSASNTGGETSVTCEGGLTDVELTTCVSMEGQDSDSAADCPACPCKGLPAIQGFPPRFAYMTEMAEAVQQKCSRTWDWSGDSFNVLVLGMGGGAMATHIAKVCPKGVHVDGVEYDGRVVGVSERYFGVTPSDSMAVEQADALDAVQQRMADGRTYDAVLIDCFSEGGVTPEHCRNSDFVSGLHTLIGSHGFVAHHLWHMDKTHEEVAPEFNATVNLYRSHFNGTRVQPLATMINDVVYSWNADAGEVASDAM